MSCVAKCLPMIWCMLTKNIKTKQLQADLQIAVPSHGLPSLIGPEGSPGSLGLYHFSEMPLDMTFKVMMV